MRKGCCTALVLGCFGEDVVLCRELSTRGSKGMSHCVEVSGRVIQISHDQVVEAAIFLA